MLFTHTLSPLLLLFNENSLIVQNLLSSYYILGTVVGTADKKK